MFIRSRTSMSAIPKVCRAIVHTPDDHTLSMQHIPVPVPDLEKGEEHLIAVRAVGLTRTELDWPKLPSWKLLIPGFDVSGIVVQAPHGSPLPVGTPIYARLGEEPWYDDGAACAYAVIKLSHMAEMPSNLSYEEAATVPISALTAWQALFVHGGWSFAPTSEPGTEKQSVRILVNGASGGVGIFAVQLAKLAGLHVVAVCGSSNVEFLRDLGAHEVIDYNKEDFCEWFQQAPNERAFDLVFDCAGGLALRKAWMMVRAGGMVISVAEEPKNQKPIGVPAWDVKDLYFVVKADRTLLEFITELIKGGLLHVFLERIWEMEDYQRAFQVARSGQCRGKVVLRVTEEPGGIESQFG